MQRITLALVVAAALAAPVAAQDSVTAPERRGTIGGVILHFSSCENRQWPYVGVDGTFRVARFEVQATYFRDTVRYDDWTSTLEWYQGNHLAVFVAVADSLPVACAHRLSVGPGPGHDERRLFCAPLPHHSRWTRRGVTLGGRLFARVQIHGAPRSRRGARGRALWPCERRDRILSAVLVQGVGVGKRPGWLPCPPVHPVLQTNQRRGGRHASEWVDGIRRNGWTARIVNGHRESDTSGHRKSDTLRSAPRREYPCQVKRS